MNTLNTLSWIVILWLMFLQNFYLGLGDGLVGLLHTSSASKVADVLTKFLPGRAHHFHIRKLGVVSLFSLKGTDRIGPFDSG